MPPASLRIMPARIDQNQKMEELFRDYFKHEKGQAPNEEIMQLFTELLAEEEVKA